MLTILIIITVGIVADAFRQERKLKNYLDTLKEKSVLDPASVEIRK
jgi:hypothetical protein